MQIKEGELTLLTFCTCKWSDKNPTKGVSNPRNPTSRSADVSGFTFFFITECFYRINILQKDDIYLRADAVTDVR